MLRKKTLKIKCSIKVKKKKKNVQFKMFILASIDMCVWADIDS